LNEVGEKIITELSGHWMKANEEVLGAILNRQLRVSYPILKSKPVGEESSLLRTGDFLAFPLAFSSGILGNIYLIFSKQEMAAMVDIIIGGDGSVPTQEFDELHLNVLEEAINQITESLESIMSNNLSRRVRVRPGKPDPGLKDYLKNFEMVYIESTLQVEGLHDSKMEVLIPADFSKELVGQMTSTMRPRGAMMSESAQAQPSYSRDEGGKSMYRKAVFPQLNEGQEERTDTKLDLLMDIPLELTVVLGKTQINFKELIELGPGSIIELEKLAGEPAEIYVNNRLVGFGEVIVIEESFGIRIIETMDDNSKAFRREV
jgi:flagellar motor switch protein FliN